MSYLMRVYIRTRLSRLCPVTYELDLNTFWKDIWKPRTSGQSGFLDGFLLMLVAQVQFQVE